MPTIDTATPPGADGDVLVLYRLDVIFN